MSAEIAPFSAHTHCYYSALDLKSLAQKLTEKMRFYVNSAYMTFSDLQGHRRSKASVQNERLYGYV